ncbi:MAG: hypothetical protein AAF761_02680 [Pseudomonadota bacterium]
MTPALVFFAVATPFCLWAAWTDLRHMKILNVCTGGLFAAFVLVGALALPLDVYGVRLAQAALMLVVGIGLNSTGHMVGGDSNFIAAMAPYVALQDAGVFLMILAAMSLFTVALHRGVGLITPLQPALTGWKSWNAGGKFPFGVTLAASLLAYLTLAL